MEGTGHQRLPAGEVSGRTVPLCHSGICQHSSKSYGDVSMTEHSRAHLGDNNFSIQQLNLTILEPRPTAQADTIEDERDRERSQHEKEEHELQLTIFKRIQNALYFREEAYRRSAVKEAHSRTFSWIFEDSTDSMGSEFVKWLTARNGCFWINGKAGSGKSTLMKYVSGHVHTKTLLENWASGRQLVIANFFFWHMGTDIQKSLDGVLRSLLRQVLMKRPHLIHSVFPDLYSYLHHLKDCKVIQNEDLNLSMVELQRGMDLLIQTMPEDLAICLMIDGVDEYSGDHIDFCNFMLRIGSSSAVKVLISSRPIPACCEIFVRCPSFRMQDLTIEDIRNYVQDKLIESQLFQDMEQAEDGFAREILAKLTSKASGVFLWVVLVVKELLIGLINYDDRDTLEQRIDKLPSDLEELYDHMFSRMSPEYRQEASMLLQITRRALEAQIHGFDALQMSFVDRSTSYEKLSKQNIMLNAEQEARRVKIVEGRLRSRCCGLIEVQKRSSNMDDPESEASESETTEYQIPDSGIQFLHRSVIEYLDSPAVWQKVINLCNISEPEINRILLASCVAYVTQTRHAFARDRNNEYSKQRATMSRRVVPDLTDCRNARLFEEATQYSKALSCAGDNTYVKYLQLAESRCSKHFDKLHSSSNSSLTCQLYNRMKKFCDQEHKQHSSPSVNIDHAMFCIAIGPLPEFWFHKLQKYDTVSSEDGLPVLLIRLIELVGSEPPSSKIYHK